ncbi:3927_t:CDS:2 [Entrophospora sp. SA101]|nr:3927_t:CDS:2 [Entrophospora sp. SA101]
MSNSQTSPLDESLFTFDYNSLQQEIEKVPKEDKVEVTSFDSDVVKEVGDKVEKLGVCLKHLNYDQNTLHRPQIGESHFNETPSETTSLDSAVTTSSNNQMIPSFFLLNMLPEPLFVDNQFTNEWVEKFNNVFSTLCEENGKDFGVDKINDSIQEYIKSGCCLPPPIL